MAYEVTVEKTNNSFLTIHSNEPCVHDELYEFFKVKDPSHRPNKFSKYDGFVRLYDRQTGKLPAGLLKRLLPRLKSYSVTLDQRLRNTREITEEEIIEWVDGLGLPPHIVPHDYQYRAVFLAIKYRRLTELADTGAGKTLIMYLIIRFWYELGNNRTLIMVPSVLLAKQALEDFVSYGWKDARGLCQQIMDGASKVLKKPIVIATWQSIQDMDSEYFESIDGIIHDEVHGAQAKKQSKIVSLCKNAADRVGLTGTLNGTELHSFQVEACHGPIMNIVDTQRLQELGQAAETKVIAVHMKYSRLDLIRFQKLDYQGAVSYVLEHRPRQMAVANLVRGLSDKRENSLVLFERVEDGLYKFKQILEDMGVGARVRVIEGSVGLNARFETKQELEDGEGLILLATWGTLSTGVNIKKIHNLFLNSSTKGLIRVLQAVGRALRVHETKSYAKIFDIIDDTRKDESSFSYFIDHAKERFGFYKMKGHPVSSLAVPLSGEGPSREVYERILREVAKRIANRDPKE